jgi:hypothetical protein
MSSHIIRSMAIFTVREIVFFILWVLGMLLVAEFVPPVLFGIVYQIIFLLLTYLMADWMFRPRLMQSKELLITVVVTYAWGALFGAGLHSWLFQENVLLTQEFTPHLIFFTLHVIGIYGALYSKRHTRSSSNLAEGLET